MNLVLFICANLALCATLSRSSIVENNVGLEVANGKMETVRRDLLSFRSEPGKICKVEVVQNEPMYQRVGKFTPEIFDCDYLPNSVRYEHNGSPLLVEDVVKMRAYVLLSNLTLQETVYFRITIVNSRCDIIRTNAMKLVVPRSTKISNPITRDVMDFDYDRAFDNTCEVRIMQTTLHEFPAYGQLVVPDNSSSPREQNRDPQFAVSTSITKPCEEFLLMGLRYEHLSPPTPDVDYIPIHVIVRDRRSRSILQQESHWLPVTIAESYPNQSPKPSFSNMYIVEVDQFVLTNILPMAVSVNDGETAKERLIFNITKQPEFGFIAHLSDHGKQIDSFWQQDIEELQIAYQPPNRSFSERQSFEVEFVVYDSYFAESNPIKVLLSIRVAYTNAPRVSWNKGLTMWEGQSRTITQDKLQVVDKDNLDQVRFTLAGGLRHGRLYVHDRPGFTFNWRDVQNGVVSYRHDDTDTRKDFVVLRISDGIHSTRFKLPISILPKDDAPPFLINNIVFQVQEGQVILIHRFMLEASDADSSPDYIRFNITRFPRAGEVQKKRKWERAGWRVDTFEQKDLYQGLIYYKHLGEEVFEDSFDFVLTDSQRPTPNVSPKHTVRIKVTPVDDLPPHPGPGNSLALTVNETDVVHLTTNELHYVDVERNKSDVTYTLTTPCYRLDSNDANRDAGHLVFTDDMVMLMKDPDVPTLGTFTQSAVDHLKVAYMPPIDDVGLHPVDVTCTFSVSDDGGKELTGQQFAITVLPVDNQAPHIQVTELCLNEGDSEIIAADLVQVRDDDTAIEDLRIILSRLPSAGEVRKRNVALNLGDSFTSDDVHRFIMTYVHDGSESHQDHFELTVTDGRQNSTAILPVKMQAVDDEHAAFLGSSGPLKVLEGGSKAFTSDFISATDEDTEDSHLIFEVLNPPLWGDITSNGEPVKTFFQSQVASGEVMYTHGGDEIGTEPVSDSATLMVSDRPGQPTDLDENSTSILDLHFLILPVNNQPPSIAVGHEVFRCDEADSQVITDSYLMAEDIDTPLTNLTFLITSEPIFGYIEDITPLPGYEKVVGKRTKSFNHDQLVAGYIQYVQSDHSGIEPTSDQFSIQVTDGQFQSVEIPFLVAIIPANDEEPILSYDNITCEEGHMQPLTLSIEDLDIPSDQVMITVSQPPKHGMVMDEMLMLSRYRRSENDRQRHSQDYHAMHHDMEPMHEFSLQQFERSTILPAYMHDGSETGVDGFELKVSDGRHTVRRSLTVKIMPVNDERPVIERNDNLELELGEAKVISGVVLHASDADTPASQLIYELHSAPRRGSLQLKIGESEDDWRDLEYAETFTELDVEMNKLRYHHRSVLGSKSQDSFRFSVTDGDHTTPRQNFLIQIQHTRKSDVHVVTNPAHVNESGQVFITTDVLVARDDSYRPQDISFDVIREPTYGRLEFVNFPGVSIQMFTQLDLLARNVVYIHVSKADSPNDSFRVQAHNGMRSREADIHIIITPVDSELPTLEIKGSDAGSDVSSELATSLMLYSASSAVISDRIIRITDPDSPKENIQLMVVEYPEHGILHLNGQQITMDNLTITQQDLETSKLVYQHGGNNAEFDRFSFTVSDGVHSGYIYKGRKRTKPTRLYIQISRIDETPPVITVNQEPTTIQPKGNGKKYVIYLDSHVLQAEDAGTSSDDISFIVSQPPSYGHIKAVGSDADENPITRFTQSDLNARGVMYVISAKLDVTNDSFVFDVEDAWGNDLPGNRFAMSWSRAEINQTKLKICEQTGVANVGIHRYGNLRSSSFVSVTVKSGSAKLNIDFDPQTALQIQFDPMMASQSWHTRIIQDNIEERKEKFRIIFHSPVNTVLAPRHVCAIIILDRSHRSCSNTPGQRRNKKRNKKKPKKTSSKKRKKERKLQKDSPAESSQNGKRNLVRYGKLGPGITVSPSSFFRNKTYRIWTYHGLIPMTVDETDALSIDPLRQSSLSVAAPEPTTALRRQTEDREINDDPSNLLSQHLLYKGKISVTNSNTSAIITVRGRSDASSGQATSTDTRRSEHVKPSRPIPQPCILAKAGSLFYDTIASVLFQCNGAKWVPWKMSHAKTSKKKKKPTKQNSCEDGWKEYERRCFYIGKSSERLSWNSAQRECREHHSANLASIHNRKQLKWLWKKTRKTQFFVGLNRKLNPTMWEWVDGEEVAFANWKRNFPRHQLSGGEACTVVASRTRWIDTSCTVPHADRVKYVCVKRP